MDDEQAAFLSRVLTQIDSLIKILEAAGREVRTAMYEPLVRDAEAIQRRVQAIRNGSEPRDTWQQVVDETARLRTEMDTLMSAMTDNEEMIKGVWRDLEELERRDNKP